jgi:acyl-CoA synthetase (AMP-forming)/AMP-acid ligase II
MNLYQEILKLAQEKPDKTLASFNGDNLSNETFIEKTAILSRTMLSYGIKPSDKIGLILPNSSLWFIVYWSAVKIGAIPVPLDPQIGEWEMLRLLSITDIKLCFVAEMYRSNRIADQLNNIKNQLPKLEKVITCTEPDFSETFFNKTESLTAFKEINSDFVYQPEISDALMLACTSGSTDNPKIITVPHYGFYKAQADMGKYLNLGNNDIMLLGMPLYHQGGFGMGLQTILMGGTVLYQTVFDPVRFLQTIVNYKTTVIQLTATLAKILLSVPDFDNYDLSSLKLAYFAGEVLPMNIAEAFFLKRNIRVVNVIGSSETATMVVWDSRYDSQFDVNEFKILPFTKVKVLNQKLNEVNEGEIGSIFIHTDALILNYFKNEKETKDKLFEINDIKWFNTGDLAMKISQGRIRFTGREKRIIKRGANLIYPEEVESFLLTHPKIAAIAIVSEKHELIGEQVNAYLQVMNKENITRGDIVKFCKGKLAAYKIPDQVVVLDEIPHDIGKIQFKYLKNMN